MFWTLIGDAAQPAGGGVVMPEERLSWPLGARIWIEARVDFRDPVNLITAAVALIAGAANYTVHTGGLEFNGIAIGSFGAIIVYHVLRRVGRASSSPLEHS